MTEKQQQTIGNLAARFTDPRTAKEIEAGFAPQFDLPDGWVAGWIHDLRGAAIYVGVSPEGEAHS